MQAPPPPADQASPHNWRSAVQPPHWAVFLLGGCSLVITAIWALLSVRSGTSTFGMVMVVTIPVLVTAITVVMVSGYCIYLTDAELKLRSTLGNVHGVRLPLNGITHAYPTEISSSAWSPNMPTQRWHTSMPVNPGPAVVLRIDNGAHIRIAVPNAGEVVDELQRRGITRVVPE